MNDQRRNQMMENSTKLTTIIISSLTSNLTTSSTVRTRTVVSTIYIAGIAFMIGVFLILLWVNLCSRHCWCWHDTSFSNRFNRQWLIRRSIAGQDIHTPSKDEHQRRQSHEEELE
ncbi:hypothetical protein I4U23_007757 [Adineta vaga]|nr:hypothetical protein I4U23_007757 [Adineta vaga]